jgi:murein DD-endopeptidase MepM/ murein hydrolase activator NlpD
VRPTDEDDPQRAPSASADSDSDAGSPTGAPPATSPSGSEPARGPRFVGSIVDPDVDGDDPWGTGESLSAPLKLGSSPPPSDVERPAFAERAHPVRQRLLARASGQLGQPSKGAGADLDSASDAAPTQPRLGSRRPLERTPAAPPATPSVAPFDRLGSRRSERPRTPTPAPVRSEHLTSGLEDLAHGEPGAPRTGLDSELDRIALGPTGQAESGRTSQLSPNMVALFGALLGLTTVGSLVALASRVDLSRPVPPLAASASAAPPSAAPASAPPPEARQKLPPPWRIADEKGKPEFRIIGGRIGSKAFLKAIQDAGVEKSQAYRAYNALKGVVELNRCKPADEWQALIERRTGKLFAFEYIPSKEEVYQAGARDGSALEGKKLDLKVARNQVRRAFVYDGQSFDASARAGGFDDHLDDVLSKALGGHMTLSELERGDRLRVIVQEVTVLGDFSRYAGVEAVEVLKKGDKPLRVYFYGHATDGGYFDDDARAPFEGGWRKPIPGAPITSKFNPKRMHPVLHKVMPHTGTDFGAPTGTPIGASSPGTVSFIGNGGPSGNLVKVQHPGGIETGYAHMSRFAEGLKLGDKVKRLQLLGYVGSTGRSTGPHLHFTAKRNGEFFDAETLNLDGMRVLPPSQRGPFTEVKAKYDALLDAIPLPAELAPAVAAAPAVAPEMGAAEPDLGDPGDAHDIPEPAAAAPATPQPAAPNPAPAKAPPAGAPAAPKSGSSVFLSDEELLRQQGMSDDGEVD